MAEAPETSEDPLLCFGLLGPLQVLRAGVSLHLGGRQQRTVLAMVLIEPDRLISVSRLADGIWGCDPPPGSVTTIQTYVSHLREVLEPNRERGAAAELLVTAHGSYRLRTARVRIDALEFEERAAAGRALLAQNRFAEASRELTAALALWRGRVLADLADYEFARLAAMRLEEAKLVAIEDRLEADLALGRHRVVAGELDELIAANPLRERLHEHRMLARYRCGRQSDALCGYHELRTMLTEEMGVDPGRPLQRLYQAILDQDPALDWLPPPTPSSPPRTSDGPKSIHPRARPMRRRLVVAAATATIAAAVLVGVVAARSSPRASPTIPAIPANSVGELDASGALRAAVAVGQSPSGLAFGAGSLWVANGGDGTVSRINPDRHTVVQKISVGTSPDAITVVGDDVWVTNSGAGTVSHINALSDTQVDVIRVGNQPTAIAGDAHGVWVANSADDTVQRIDPRSGAADAPIPVGGNPDGIAVRGNTLWVADGQDAAVVPIDATSRIVGSSVGVGAGPAGLVVTEDALWVANALDLTVSRVDLASGRVTRTVPAGDGPNAIVANSDAVWVANEFDGTVTRIDPHTGEAISQIAVGGSPRGMTLIGASPWVATGAFVSDAAHRGGTLTIEGDTVPGGPRIDFMYSYDQPTLAFLYDGLVAQRRTGGAAGLTLVPDLATNLPRPSDGGRIYTFTLRRGIRYSTGKEVRPADILHGLLRALRGPRPDYLAGIIGAKQCAASPATCDLSEGVVIDDLNYRITLRLTAADPEFLYKLSLFVYASPPEVPLGESMTPIPTTGPYQVTGYKEGVKELTLTRNPYFRRWSFAAKPDGYPDEIKFTKVVETDRRVADVATNHIDFMNLQEVQPAEITDLNHRYPSRMHSDFALVDYYAWLDTRTEPFNDVRVRQAINYAVDRNRLVTLSGGASSSATTCQTFPPGFPGYRPYCPYTRQPTADGHYHGPDMAAAASLARASGTIGMPVKVVSEDDDPTTRALADYYVSVLNILGYRASVVTYPGTYQGDSRYGAQLGIGYWGADFAAPSNFWAPILSCDMYRSPGEWTTNLSSYCNKDIDSLAGRALALEGSDPSAARRLWTEVDRRLTDDAPLVFSVTLRQIAFVSSRVGNFQFNPVVGPLLDQIWVR